jgi:hypothetical protein
MPAPILVDCIPASGAVEVPTNSVVRLSFSTPLMASTCIEGVFNIVNVETDEIMQLAILQRENEVTLQAGRAFEDYTRYEIQVVGADVTTPNGPLKAEDGTPLAKSIYYSFLTSHVIHYGETDTQSGMYMEGIDASGQTVEVFVPYFNLDSSVPPEDEMFVPPDYLMASGIVLDFTLPVDPATVSGGITVEQRPFVDRRFAWTAPSDILNCHFPPPSGMINYSYAVMDSVNHPATSFTVSGSRVTINFTESGAVKWNSQFIIGINSNLMSLPASGLTDGQPLQSGTALLFSEGMFPWYAEIEQVREALGGYNPAFTDYVVARYILKNSLRAYRVSCMKFDPYNPPYYINDYVVLRSLLDILGGPPTLAILGGEMTKTLGDLTIGYNDPTASLKTIVPSWEKATDEYEKWLKTLCVNNPGGIEVISAVRSSATADYPPWRYRERHMYNASFGEALGFMGADNTKWDRISKNPRLNERYINYPSPYVTATGFLVPGVGTRF